MLKNSALIFLFFIGILSAKSQSNFSDTLVGIQQKPVGLKSLNVGGSYRFLTQHRMMTSDPYVTVRTPAVDFNSGYRSILVGDASQLPELTLNIGGNPSKRSSFGTDLVVWNQNNGNFDYYRGLQLGVNMYGSFETDYGNVNIRAGGIHWYQMTPFTFKAFEGYNRYTLFERNPWDPVGKTAMTRYDEYFNKGAITQDVRFGSQAFQGIITDFTDLPWGFDASIMYGKTQLNGGFESLVPDYTFGGRLVKNIENLNLSINTIQSRAFQDSLATLPVNYGIGTINADYNGKYFSILSEFGLGRYMENAQGDAARIRLILPKRLTGVVPFELSFYRISPNIYNNNAEFFNTSISEQTTASIQTNQTVAANGVLRPTGAAMVGIGQMTNNRQAYAINTDVKVGKDLVFVLGNSIEHELVKGSSFITYGHTINGLQMSRFWRWTFPSNVGPYGRKNVIFRGVYEKVQLRENNDTPEEDSLKYFNTIEAQAKYHLRIGKKNWYWFYLGSYASAQNYLSPITVFTERAFIRSYNHQLESYLDLTKEMTLSTYLGWERTIGNYDTEIEQDTRRPRNQEGFAMGLGLDISLSKNTALYLRHRWFSFEDRSFPDDAFKAKETSLEIKTYF